METKKRQPKKLPKILSREDVKKILAVPNVKTITGLRNRTILQILYRAGLRVEEVCNLAPADIRVRDGHAEIFVQAGKGNVDRVVPIDVATFNWLQKWEAVRIPGDFLFMSHRGKKLDQSYIRKMVYQSAEKAGVYIQDGRELVLPSPHNFRHTYATELLQDGFSIAEVKTLLGHSSIQTTQVYLHVVMDDLAEKIRGRVTA
jgi:site-specific recombinase XerD